MDRSIFLARLIAPTFFAIALGMLINLGIYESLIAEACAPALCRLTIARPASSDSRPAR